jgi:hypothetical protein
MPSEPNTFDWVGPIVGVIVGAVGTLVTERVNLWLNRPGIRIEFQPDEHCLRYSDAQASDGARTFLTKSKFLRVRVKNHRRYTAKGCRCLITSIRKTLAAGSSLTVLFDTLPLRWAYLDFKPIDIPAGAYFYADLISALRDHLHFTVELPVQPLALQGTTTETALYTFDVAVVGDNFDPERIRLFLDWKQTWDFKDVWSESMRGKNAQFLL